MCSRCRCAALWTSVRASQYVRHSPSDNKMRNERSARIADDCHSLSYLSPSTASSTLHSVCDQSSLLASSPPLSTLPLWLSSHTSSLSCSRLRRLLLQHVVHHISNTIRSDGTHDFSTAAPTALVVRSTPTIPTTQTHRPNPATRTTTPLPTHHPPAAHRRHTHYHGPVQAAREGRECAGGRSGG